MAFNVKDQRQTYLRFFLKKDITIKTNIFGFPRVLLFPHIPHKSVEFNVYSAFICIYVYVYVNL